MQAYLQPNYYTDSDHPDVVAYASRITQGIHEPAARMQALFRAVRDDFRYNPYRVILKPYALKASYLLSKDYGYCIEKSNLLAACARALGVASRLGFANVRNHLATEKLERYLRTDLLVFHGYTELFLHGRWIKLTPVFDRALCERLGVDPLDFDGANDCIFQQSDKGGKPFMEYVHDHGTFDTVPLERFKAEMQRVYPHLFERPIRTEQFEFDF